MGDYFTKIENTPEAEIKIGDIPVWNSNTGGGAGHIAISLSKTVKAPFTSLDQNWGGKSAHRVEHNFNNVYGWLRPKENMADTVAVPTKDFENLVKKSTYWDGVVSDLAVPDLEGYKSVVAGYRSRITDLTNQLGTAQAEVKNRIEQVDRLKADIANLESLLKERTDQVNLFAREKGELAVQVEQLKVQVETLKQQQAQGEITISFIDLLHLILQQKVTIKK